MANCHLCQKCSSGRFLTLDVRLKCDQELTIETENKCTTGDSVVFNDVPNILSSNIVCFTVCLDCGQMQGNWPVEKLYMELE